MRDLIKTANCTSKILRETSSRATTTVVAITDNQDTVCRLHYEFRLFDDIRLIQISETQVRASSIRLLLNEQTNQPTNNLCFILFESQTTLCLVEIQSFIPESVFQRFVFGAENALNATIDEIKKTTRNNRRQLDSPSLSIVAL